MQSGSHTVGDGMRRHLVTLERERENLEQSIRLCGRLTDCQKRMEELDAGTILTEMETMEHAGTTFQNKQRLDVRIRYVAPVAVTVVMVLLMLGLMWLFLWGFETDPAGGPPLPLLAILMAIPGVVALGVIVSLVQRIREIGKGEIDDAKQF